MSNNTRAIANALKNSMIESGGTSLSLVRNNVGLPAIDQHVAPNSGFEVDTPLGAFRVIVCELELRKSDA